MFTNLRLWMAMEAIRVDEIRGEISCNLGELLGPLWYPGTLYCENSLPAWATPGPALPLSRDRLSSHNSSLSLSFLPFTRLLFLYDFHSLFNPFSASLASCLIYFLSVHYPHVSHSHLFFYASISASSFITEVIFILPFHFPFYLCF